MKTVVELNKKWWYRLLKVFFIGTVIITSLTTIYLFYEEVGYYQNDYLIKCNYGNKESFLAYKDKEIVIYGFSVYTGGLENLPDSVKKELQNACEISEEEKYEKAIMILNNADNGKKLFDITETKVPVSSYFKATLWSVFSLIIIILIAEVVRRTFYYVVLGKIKPE